MKELKKSIPFKDKFNEVIVKYDNLLVENKNVKDANKASIIYEFMTYDSFKH